MIDNVLIVDVRVIGGALRGAAYLLFVRLSSGRRYLEQYVTEHHQKSRANHSLSTPREASMSTLKIFEAFELDAYAFVSDFGARGAQLDDIVLGIPTS